MRGCAGARAGAHQKMTCCLRAWRRRCRRSVRRHRQTRRLRPPPVRAVRFAAAAPCRRTRLSRSSCARVPLACGIHLQMRQAERLGKAWGDREGRGRSNHSIDRRSHRMHSNDNQAMRPHQHPTRAWISSLASQRRRLRVLRRCYSMVALSIETWSCPIRLGTSPHPPANLGVATDGRSPSAHRLRLSPDLGPCEPDTVFL